MAPDEHGRFNPAGAAPPLPGTTTGKCLHTPRGHLSRRRGRTVFRPQRLQVSCCPRSGPGVHDDAVMGRIIHNALRIEAGGCNVRVKIGTVQHWRIRWGQVAPSRAAAGSQAQYWVPNTSDTHDGQTREIVCMRSSGDAHIRPGMSPCMATCQWSSVRGPFAATGWNPFGYKTSTHCVEPSPTVAVPVRAGTYLIGGTFRPAFTANPGSTVRDAPVVSISRCATER